MEDNFQLYVVLDRVIEVRLLIFVLYVACLAEHAIDLTVHAGHLVCVVALKPIAHIFVLQVNLL